MSAEVYEQAVRRILEHTYKPDGVAIWLSRPKQRLGGRIPIEAIQDGAGLEVLTVALAVDP